VLILQDLIQVILQGRKMACNQYHWIDNNLRSSQKFESGQTETYSIFGGFYKLQVRGKRIKKISFKKIETGQIYLADAGQHRAGPASEDARGSRRFKPPDERGPPVSR
jgi:hypothetical protein